jgi:hypothetical protein
MVSDRLQRLQVVSKRKSASTGKCQRGERNSDYSSMGGGLRHFQMRQRKGRFDEQYQLAGDAVMIAPVSSEIPCKQGIFQGISQD